MWCHRWPETESKSWEIQKSQHIVQTRTSTLQFSPYSSSSTLCTSSTSAPCQRANDSCRSRDYAFASSTPSMPSPQHRRKPQRRPQRIWDEVECIALASQSPCCPSTQSMDLKASVKLSVTSWERAHQLTRKVSNNSSWSCDAKMTNEGKEPGEKWNWRPH